MAPTDVAIIGSEAAIASIRAIGDPSLADDITKISAELYVLVGSGTYPRNITEEFKPALVTYSFNSFSKGPFPVIVSPICGNSF